MKKIFNNPEIEIMLLGNQDIITTSGDNTRASGEENDGNETPDW